MNKEKAKELLKVFKNGISHNPKNGLNNVIEFQDVIGHSTLDEINHFYGKLEKPEKKHFIWSCMNTLSEDTATDIIYSCIIEPAGREVMAEAETLIQDAELRTWEAETKAAKSIEANKKELENLRTQVAHLQNTIAENAGVIERLYNENDNLRKDAHDLATIKRILNA